MGYEIKLYLGEINARDEMRQYFHEIASIDLSCVCDSVRKVIDTSEGALGTPVYLYASNGNDKLIDDFYGKDLRAFDAEILLKAIKKANQGEKYRRYDMAISLLEAFIKAGFNRPSVVAFGH